VQEEVIQQFNYEKQRKMNKYWKKEM